MRARLAAEYVLLYFVLVGGYAVAGVPGGPIPPLVVLSVMAAFYLRRSAGAGLWRGTAVRAALPRVLGLWAVLAVAMTAAVAVADPAALFALPRSRPWWWAATCTGRNPASSGALADRLVTALDC